MTPITLIDRAGNVRREVVQDGTRQLWFPVQRSLVLVGEGPSQPDFETVDFSPSRLVSDDDQWLWTQAGATDVRLTNYPGRVRLVDITRRFFVDVQVSEIEIKNARSSWTPEKIALSLARRDLKAECGSPVDVRVFQTATDKDRYVRQFRVSAYASRVIHDPLSGVTLRQSPARHEAP